MDDLKLEELLIGRPSGGGQHHGALKQLDTFGAKLRILDGDRLPKRGDYYEQNATAKVIHGPSIETEVERKAGRDWVNRGGCQVRKSLSISLWRGSAHSGRNSAQGHQAARAPPHTIPMRLRRQEHQPPRTPIPPNRLIHPIRLNRDSAELSSTSP